MTTESSHSVLSSVVKMNGNGRVICCSRFACILVLPALQMGKGILPDIICPIRDMTESTSCHSPHSVIEYLSLTDNCPHIADRKGIRNAMKDENRYFVLKQKAVPEVLLKVVEAKRLLDSERGMTVQEATDAVGISRSSFYKYKEDIFPFHDNSLGRTVTFTMQMDDEPGLLSDVLKIVARFQANILTIHQSIPINGVASLSISVQVLPTTQNISGMIETMEVQKGVRNVKILAKE